MIAIAPVRTLSPNRTSGEHWGARSARAAKQVDTVYYACLGASGRRPALPVVVTLTRLSAGALDGHDNLRASLKHVVDGVARYLKVDDADPRVEWRYAQQTTKRGQYAVEIRIEPRDGTIQGWTTPHDSTNGTAPPSAGSAPGTSTC